MTAKSTSFKSDGCGYGDCALKAVEHTSGGLPHVSESELRADRSALPVGQKSTADIGVPRGTKAWTRERTVRKRVSCGAIRQPISLQVELEQVVSGKGLRRNSASGGTTISAAFIGLEPLSCSAGVNSSDRRMRTRLSGGTGGEERWLSPESRLTNHASTLLSSQKVGGLGHEHEGRLCPELIRNSLESSDRLSVSVADLSNQ